MAGEEILEIVGNIATYKTVTINRRVPLAELLGRVERAPRIVAPTTPRSSVFFAWDQEGRENKMYMLCETPPSVRSIVKANGARKFRYKLGMPWTYFWFIATTVDITRVDVTHEWSISTGHIFMSKDKYNGTETPLMVAPLPNVNATGEICWGSTAANRRQNLADQIDERVNGWYLSEFNDHLDRHIRFPYGEKNMGRWVRETETNPMAWRDWPEWDLTDRRFTVKTLLEQQGREFTMLERYPAAEFIPPAPLPMTFGRWEEWAADIPSDQRFRLLTTLNNMAADNPETVRIAPAVAAAAAAVNANDGGVPV